MVKIAVNGRGRPPVQALYRVSTRSRCVRHSVYTGCCRNNRGRLDPILFARSLAAILSIPDFFGLFLNVTKLQRVNWPGKLTELHAMRNCPTANT